MYREWYPKDNLSRAMKQEVTLGPIHDVLPGGGINVFFGGPKDFFFYQFDTAYEFNIILSGLLQLGEQYRGTYQLTPS